MIIEHPLSIYQLIIFLAEQYKNDKRPYRVLLSRLIWRSSPLADNYNGILCSGQKVQFHVDGLFCEPPCSELCKNCDPAKNRVSSPLSSYLSPLLLLLPAVSVIGWRCLVLGPRQSQTADQQHNNIITIIMVRGSPR